MAGAKIGSSTFVMSNKCFEEEKRSGASESAHRLGGRDIHRIDEKTKGKAGKAKIRIASIYAVESFYRDCFALLFVQRPTGIERRMGRLDCAYL